MFNKIIKYILLTFMFGNLSVIIHAKPIDKKVENKALESITQTIILLNNADKVYTLSNISKGNKLVHSIIKSIEPFKENTSINNAITYLKIAQTDINAADKITGEDETSFMNRKFYLQKAINSMYHAEDTIKFGEIPLYKTSLEAKRDFLNRIDDAKKSLDQALADIKLKKPDIKRAFQSIEQARSLIRPFLKFRIINMADTFLNLYALPHLEQAKKDTEKLEMEKNVQHSILSIVFAKEFLKNAEDELRK